MHGVYVKTKSRKESEWLLSVIKRMQLEGRVATIEEIEDEGMVRAIKTGETGKYVNTKAFISKLRGK